MEERNFGEDSNNMAVAYIMVLKAFSYVTTVHEPHSGSVDSMFRSIHSYLQRSPKLKSTKLFALGLQAAPTLPLRVQGPKQ